MTAIKNLPGIHIIKVFPQHLSDPLLQSIIAEFKPHIIFLRRNHLDRFVSHKKANASGKWHTASTSDLVIDLDVQEFDTFIANYTKFYTDYYHFAKEQGCEILDVDFSDLHNPEKVREIQAFAQFEDFKDWDKLTLAPTTVKQDRSSKVQEDFLEKTGKSYKDYEFKAVTS
jgi:LPS sulfotransferase NodH